MSAHHHHHEPHLVSSDLLRDIVIGMSDGLTVPFALAAGLKTFKMHKGHRGINHPVKNLKTGRSEITSQNHGFSVDPASLTPELAVEITHVNLNDNSIEGIRLKKATAFSVQYHPEACPGPYDSRYLFDDFISTFKG